MWCLIWCFNKSWKPPDGDHDKVIWKCSRDRSRDKASRQSNSETWWRRTTATLLGVSFGSYRRRRRDVPQERRGYVLLRRLGDVPLRCRCMFHLRLIWDVVKTYWWDVVITSPWGVVTTYQWRHTSWRRFSETSWRLPLRRRWVFQLRGTCDVAGTYRKTSPGRLAAGWDISVLK